MHRSALSENHVYFREGAENRGVSGGKKAHHPPEIVPGPREASGPLIELAELEMAGIAIGILLQSFEQTRFRIVDIRYSNPDPSQATIFVGRWILDHRHPGYLG
jgi:hypothetical protein